MGFSVAFECLQSFLHAFLKHQTCFDALQPSQSDKPEIGQILKFLIFLIFSNELAQTCELTRVHTNTKSS